ncbi:MAG: winged helix DNA-binding domain-containing protein, partial [Actinomycetota bacterium]|nr:winged helix DNA-binding domain-containing protein [Actinomycetota bacterium]
MAAPERVLSQRELNRALLARQLLLERAPLSLPRALDRMGALQAQYAPSMYVGLWSRVQELDRGQLTRALVRRSVVQGTLMRLTIHLVSRGDYWPLSIAIRSRGAAGSCARTSTSAMPGSTSEARRSCGRSLLTAPGRPPSSTAASASEAGRASGSTSCECRPRTHGSGGAPISSGWRRT